MIYADLMTLGIELLSWIDAEMDDDCRQSLTEPLAKMMESSVISVCTVMEVPSELTASAQGVPSKPSEVY